MTSKYTIECDNEDCDNGKVKVYNTFPQPPDIVDCWKCEGTGELSLTREQIQDRMELIERGITDLRWFIVEEKEKLKILKDLIG
jgi:hypothetical protein